MNPIDRAIILDEAKQYTNSQRIAYMEGQADITFDGNIEGKEIIPGSSLVKVSDTPYDLTKVKTVTQRLSNGTYATLAADAFTFEGAEGAAYLLYGDDMCVVSSQKGSIFDEDAGVVGTFVLAVGSTWISKVEFAKTIHPIDQKFLPGVTLNLCDYGINVYELFKKGTSGYFRMDTSLARELNAKIPTDGSMVVLMTNDGINPKVLSKPVTIACLPNGKAGIVSILYKTLYFELNAILDTELYISFTYNQTDGSIDATDVYYTTTAKALPTTEVN